ncbi:MAG TPA: hypothetical protein VJ836_07720 [Candidatus Saccharimonadales bacterium]|nr:hypothetical protein [Candidatus Saccharimonadales bacterium]
MRKIELLKSQRSELGKILINKGLQPLDFQWNEIKSSYLKDTRIQSLVYKHSRYFFAFDRYKNANSSSERWACRYSPDQDISDASSITESWNNATALFSKWAAIVKRELEAEDPWVEAEEEFARDWTTSNEKFSSTELEKLDLRLEGVKQYLLEQSDRSDKTIKSIESGIENLKKSARGFGKKDWATMFVGWFFMSCTEWAISQVHWQQVVTILLKSTKTFLLQG